MTQAPLLVGTLAPDFDLPCTSVDGGSTTRTSLADYRGRWLVLVFYPLDFSMVCPTELTGLGAQIDEFRRRGAEVLGVSCDTVESHRRWVETPRSLGGLAGLGFALASDVGGAVSRAYGIYLEYQHVSLRGLFLIDPNGVLQYMAVHNLSVGRRADEVLRVLAALQTGGLCAENWSPESATLDPTAVLRPGSRISHYRIEERIGDGSFAAVFRAIDLTLRRPVALKILKPDVRTSPGTALAEARSAAALAHPNICTVYAVDHADGVALIAMEYLRGLTLRALLADGPLAPGRVARVGRQVASGMAAAHARGIVHGDLKPDNVFVTDEGLAKVLDFGLARSDRRQADPQETALLGEADSGNGLFGTPGYMAPEQARGDLATPASDVFALGSTFYELLTGRRAFDGGNILQVLGAIRRVDPEPLANATPEPFAGILRLALARDPAERRISMAEIAERLAAFGR